MKIKLDFNYFMRGICFLFLFVIISIPRSRAAERPDFEDITICRLQVRLTTANVKNAETDNALYVRFNYGDEIFYLDHGINDFERNTVRSYDVLSKKVNKIRDIQFFELGIGSKDDGWIARKIELLVNGKVIFEKYYPKGITLKKSNKYERYVVFGKPELSKHKFWRYHQSNGNMWQAPRVLPKSMMESVIEAGVGHAMRIHGNLYWDNKKHGRAHVETKFLSGNTIRVDLDLKQRIRALPDCGVDVDFDLVFNCRDGLISVELENMKINPSTMCKIGPGIATQLQEEAKKAIAVLVATKYPKAGPVVEGLLNEFVNFDFSKEVQIELGISTPGLHSCESIEVTRNGDLSISPARS